MENNKQYIPEIDIIKAICIITVVMAHARCDFLWFGYFFLIGFYFVAGMTFSLKSFKVFFLSKIKRIYIPFVLANLIAAFLVKFIHLTTHYGYLWTWNNFFSKSNFNYFKNIILFSEQESLMAPSWYLLPLFCILLILYFLVKHIKNIKTIFLIITIIFAITLILREQIIGIMWNNCAVIFNIGFGLFFVSMGYFYKLQRDKINAYLKQYSFDIFVLSIIVLFAIYNHGKYVFDLRAGQVSNIPFMILTASSGMFFLLYISKEISTRSKLKMCFVYIGQRSMSILLFHILSFNIITIIAYNVFNCDYSSNWANAIYYGWFPYLNLIVGISVPLIFEYCYEKIKRIIQKN